MERTYFLLIVGFENGRVGAIPGDLLYTHLHNNM